jgi:hypothetical protein
MGDAGEGLVDAESRLAERMEEREQEKRQARMGPVTTDPERVRETESLRLAKTEMQRQLDLTTSEVRRQQLAQALGELDKRLKALSVK